jgi:xylulokinase
MNYLLGLDIGTTGVNAMLFDLDGNSLGGAYREYPSIYPTEHQVEQDAETVLTKTFEVCRETLEITNIQPGSIQAVGITSHRASFGFLNANRQLIGNRIIVWQDNRAVSVIEDVAAKISGTELYKTTGMPLTPTYTLEKLVWFKKHQPEFFANVATVVFPADYFLWRFGAELRTEVTNACCSGMIDVQKLDWSDRILNTFGIPKSLFAPLVKPGTVIGKVSSEAARLSGLADGTPLVCATGDQQCAAIGAGVIEEGRASLTLGTAGLLVAGTRNIELEKSPGLMVPSSGRIGLYELEGIQLGAASCYRWIRDQLAIPEKQQAESTGESPFVLMEKLLHESQPGSNGILFLPFLSGAGYPLWNANASGMFTGLRFSHSRADMLRAVIEGVTLESYDMYRAMAQAGVVITSLTVTGGATASTTWRQTIADIFDLEIRPLKVSNATLVATAIFAGIGVDIYKSVEEGVARTVRYAESVKPIAENVAVLRKSYEMYKKFAVIT